MNNTGGHSMYSDFLGFSESTFFVNIADNSDVNSFFFFFHYFLFVQLRGNNFLAGN